ncbi:hypothetical protein BFP97_03360 [Roseivirga sp. 4D4]|uniref:nucleotidyltransferase domain-containing protein n=1 Tax=Roseivirga sp. 4D4 TaxID=1889784 RepID=UPI000853B8FF|nr:nucleotidyltransferase domain-containing protein [Roseivirga sp. 4D4]OEK00600.1 hypothetical protein BFP97_03360 [Roseivirga sp. 4D4]
MSTSIRAHHQKAIDRLVETYQNDTRFNALIIGGSVAKGCARDDSDVDFFIVANDNEFDKRKSEGDLFINRTDLCDYPGGFVDGKVVSYSYLQELANKGNEPSRAAFDGAFIAYSHLDGLSSMVQSIPVYQETGHKERLKAFYSMAFMQNWLMGEANRHDNIYTKSRAATQLAFYAGRLILAYNKVLYPYHKWLMHYLEKCPDKPDSVLENIKSVLNEPNLQNANRLFQSIQDFSDWGIPDHDAFLWFMEEVEWSWMNDNTALEDL